MEGLWILKQQPQLETLSVVSQRSLYTWKYIYYLQEEIFAQDGASFQSIPVARSVVTPVTSIFQMKDMDNIFPLIAS